VQSLLVASAGGHLEELWLLRPRLEESGTQSTWVTWDTPQSRSMLADEKRIFVPFANPRDPIATLRSARIAHRVLSDDNYTDVISTGSLPAVPFITLARARGIRCHFIESAARVDGPSLSARILEKVPGVHRYSQYENWSRRSWAYRGSVFDNFVPDRCPPRPIRRAVVTLGASRFGFRRLAEAVADALPPGTEVLWQTGSTDVSSLPFRARPYVSESRLAAAMREADIVISHAGVGSAITAMRAGHCPVLVPRLHRHGEHVDDHQREIAAELEHRALALACTPEELDAGVLAAAAQRRVQVCGDPPPFHLSDG
jgi:UDP-N-acetylglucosamine transferase subunit ALG13